jgi:ABC-type multidrug transport system fused ATPase/permease subunit
MTGSADFSNDRFQRRRDRSRLRRRLLPADLQRQGVYYGVVAPGLDWHRRIRKGRTGMREFYAYVWRSSASRQIVLIVLAVMAALMAMAPLELQRHIINTLAGHEEAERLFWLCWAYLIAALSIGGLKYMLNIKSAGLGESMILSLRQDIFSSTSPLKSSEALDETAKDKAGTFVAMIANEAEAVGKFVGDYFFNPAGAGRDFAQRVGLCCIPSLFSGWSFC